MSYTGFLSSSRVSKEEREFYELKHRAAEYYRANGVPQKMEAVLNSMFYDKPDDVCGYLANYFSSFSKPPVIHRLLGKEVYDGKGHPTVQAEVLCIVSNVEKSICSAVISSHWEVPDCTAQDADTLDEDAKRATSVARALQWINEPLTAALERCEPADQRGVDKLLSDFLAARMLEEQDRQRREQEDGQLDDPAPAPTPPAQPPPASKEKKTSAKGKKGATVEKPIPPAEVPEPVLPGCMAIGAVSLAVAKTAAHFKGIPLYQHISALKQGQSTRELHIPLPMVTVLSCGKSSPGKLNLMEEIIVIPKPAQPFKQSFKVLLDLRKEITRMINANSKTGPVANTVSDAGALVIGYDRLEQPLDVISEASNTLGLSLGSDIHLAINCAAHKLMDYQKGKYEVSTGTCKSPDEMVNVYLDLTSRYPGVIALIDPLRKEDQEQWETLYRALGSRCYLVAEAASLPICSLLAEENLTIPGVSGLTMKQTNQTTVSDLIQITTRLEDQKCLTVIGTTDGEPCDDALSDLAVGLGVRFVKLGGLCHGERVTKYSRLISIEEELAQQGILGSTEEHEFPALEQDTRDISKSTSPAQNNASQ
ncbi:enolase 4 isoform X2 [Amia ocellicauda]|uniref:enolase 4 isoform X2 n=1 Tax=Amia ocellicauda TaxID=2972642 RepID=UPI003464C274